MRRPWAGYPQTHPGPGDILLLIEVSDSSLDFDSTVKLELYARAGIPEVWIVDLTTDRVLVHRNPRDGFYGSAIRIEGSDGLDVEGLAGVTIPVAEVFA